MNAKELATKLNGVECSNEVTDELRQKAKANGLVIVYTSKDDLLVFDGATHNGKIIRCSYETPISFEAFINKRGEVSNKEISGGQRVAASECPEWLISTNIPSHHFYTMDNGVVHCVGLVFSLSDIDKAKVNNLVEEELSF